MLSGNQIACTDEALANGLSKVIEVKSTLIDFCYLFVSWGCGKKQPCPASEMKTPSFKPKTGAKKPSTVLLEFEAGSSVNSSPAIGHDDTV